MPPAESTQQLRENIHGVPTPFIVEPIAQTSTPLLNAFGYANSKTGSRTQQVADFTRKIRSSLDGTHQFYA